MDALPTRDLSPLERAIQAFNAGEDPSAGALQRAFLNGRVCVVSSSEVHPDGSGPLRLLGVDGGGGEAYLEVFTHEDRIDLEVGKRYPWMVNTTGENALALTAGGIAINRGSDPSLAVVVKSEGVHEMRDLAAARKSAVDARAARAPHEIETAIAEVDRNGMDAIGILRFGAGLWPATLFVPSSRPLEGTIDVDACYTFGPDDDRMLAAFTDRDQLGEFVASHLLEITGGALFHRLPPGVGIIFNPQRPDQLPLTGEGLRITAGLIEQTAPAAARLAEPQAAEAPVAEPQTAEPPTTEPPVADPPARRSLFGRRRT